MYLFQAAYEDFYVFWRSQQPCERRNKLVFLDDYGLCWLIFGEGIAAAGVTLPLPCRHLGLAHRLDELRDPAQRVHRGHRGLRRGNHAAGSETRRAPVRAPYQRPRPYRARRLRAGVSRRGVPPDRGSPWIDPPLLLQGVVRLPGVPLSGGAARSLSSGVGCSQPGSHQFATIAELSGPFSVLSLNDQQTRTNPLCQSHPPLSNTVREGLLLVLVVKLGLLCVGGTSFHHFHFQLPMVPKMPSADTENSFPASIASHFADRCRHTLCEPVDTYQRLFRRVRRLSTPQ